MNITYTVARTKDEITILAALCLNAKLYEDNGLLKHYFEVMVMQKQVRKMTIVMQRVNDMPSGVVVLYDTAHHINTYVKPGYRRMGLGSALIKELRTVTGLERSLLIAVEGISGWENFYKQNFIYVNRMHFSLEEIKKYPIDKLVVGINFNPKRAMLAKLHRSISKSI